MPNWKKIVTSGSNAAFNSLIVSNTITGSISGSLTGSLFGTASWAQSASQASTASFVQTAQTASYVTGSVFISTNPALSASYALSSLNALTASFVATASYVTGSIFTNVNPALTASYALTASFIITAQTASYVTGSVFTSTNPVLSASYALTSSFVSNTFLQGGNSFGASASLGTNDNQSLTFRTSGSNRIHVSSSGIVSIGTNFTSPFDATVHIRQGSSGVTTTALGGGIPLIVENNTTGYISVYSPSNNYSGIVFGSPSSSFGAYVRWRHSSNNLEILTNNTNASILFGVGSAVSKAWLSGTGFGINKTASAALDVSGSVFISGSLIITSSQTSASITIATQSATPTWTGREGEMVPGTSGGNFFIYTYIGGRWRSSSLG